MFIIVLGNIVHSTEILVTQVLRPILENYSHLLSYFLDFLDIDTKIVYLSSLNVFGKKQDLIINLCKHFSASDFIFGALGKNYVQEEKFQISNKLIDYFKDRYNCNCIDGVRIKFEEGWGLLRASNTQPVLVCRFEANTKENLDLEFRLKK